MSTSKEILSTGASFKEDAIMKGIKVNREKIKMNMEVCGFSKEDLCTHVGCDIRTIERIFKQPTYSTTYANEIAEALGVYVDDICENSNSICESDYRLAFYDLNNQLRSLSQQIEQVLFDYQCINERFNGLREQVNKISNQIVSIIK